MSDALRAYTSGVLRARADYYARAHEYVPDPPTPRPRATHCKQGHAFDEANTYVDSKGWQTCRACANRNRRDARARKKAA